MLELLQRRSRSRDADAAIASSTEKTTLVAEPGSILDKCVAAKPDMNDDLSKRLLLLEQYDLGFLLLGLSPRRLLRDGRLFDNEQVLPLLLWFSQCDKHCRYVAAEVMKQWLVFSPAEGEFEGVPDERLSGSATTSSRSTPFR